MIEDDVFAKIIAREIPAEILYEDEDTIVILDIHPNTPGHSLVIPKKNVVTAMDADEATFLSVMRTVHRVAPAIMAAVNADGINVLINNQAAAGQVIPHLHVHLIPRRRDDGLTHWPATSYAPGEAESIASAIRSALA